MVSGQGPNPQNQSDCQVYDDFVGTGPTSHGQAVGTGCVGGHHRLVTDLAKVSTTPNLSFVIPNVVRRNESMSPRALRPDGWLVQG